MLNYRNPWKNSYTIRLVAAVDMAFGCLLVIVYLQKLLLPISYGGDSFTETQRLPSSVKLLLLGPIIFNGFQVVMAFNLLSAGNRRSEPLIAYAKAHTWFQFSTLILFLLLVKLFLVLWFPPHGSLSRKDALGGTLIVLEVVFKIFGLFIVKEFIDDLKYILNMIPTPQYYCIYTPSPPPSIIIQSSEATTAPNLQTGATAAVYPFIHSFNRPTSPISLHEQQPETKCPGSNRNSGVATV